MAWNGPYNLKAAAEPVTETPSGTINGSNVTFTIPATGTLVLVFRNSLLQAGGGIDYTLSGTTITFAAAPLVGDTLTDVRFTTFTPTVETPSGAIDGSNVTFTLSAWPSLLSFGGWLPSVEFLPMLYRNGLLQVESGVDYTLSGSTITYAAAPLTGDSLTAIYR